MEHALPTYILFLFLPPTHPPTYPPIKIGQEKELPASCVDSALPTYMLVSGNGEVGEEVLQKALLSETFPSIFTNPMDFCGVGLSEISFLPVV